MISIPTITTIRNQIITDIETQIGATIPTAPKAFFRVLATALAGVLWLVYRFGAWVYDQIFASSADDEALERIGAQYGIVRSAATAATITATATGTNGTIIPISTLWQFDGIVYQQAAAVTISTGTAAITATALVTGADTSREAGDEIQIVSPLAGVDDVATVTATTVSGTDVEDIETLRARIVARQQIRPQGGAIPDYVAWALEVPGIVKAFAFLDVPGYVDVYPLVATTGAARIPDAGKLAEVQAHLTDENIIPMTAGVTAKMMTEKVLNITVSALTPNDTAIKTAIEDAFEAYLYRAYPQQYTDEINPTDVVSLAGLYSEAIGAGARSIVMTMSLSGGGSITSYELDIDEIIKLGTVSWP